MMRSFRNHLSQLLVRCAAGTAAAAFGASAAVAQEPAPSDSVIRAAPLRVDAVRTTATAGSASALVIALDSLRTAPAATLDQVLRELPLVTVRTNSRGEAQFSLRGSGSDGRQVAVLMDGVPLHIGWDNRVDLSVVPAGAASSLTLVRGLPSILHGPNVLGGVLEVSVSGPVVRPAQAGAAAADVALEQTGSFAASASGTVPIALFSGHATIRMGGGYRDRPGVALPGGIAEMEAVAGQSPLTGEMLRSNTDHTQASGFLSGRYDSSSGAWVSLSSSAYRAARGVAPELHSAVPRFWRYPVAARAVTVVGGGTGSRRSPLGGRGGVEGSIGFDAARTEIVSYANGAYQEIEATEDADDRGWTLRLLSDQTIGTSGELNLAFMYVDTKHDELLSGAPPARYRQRLWSAGAETAWRIDTGMRLFPSARLSIGGALDGADTPESGDKPSLGALREWGGRIGITSIHARGSLQAHAGLSRRARFPSLRELYSGALGRFEPNPKLRPEGLYAAETGLTWQRSGVEVQAVGFHRRLEGAIEQVRITELRRQRVNLGTVSSTGIELLAAAALGGVGISADLTLQDVRLSSGQVAGGGRPEYQPALIAGLQTRVALPLEVSTTVQARHVGRQYCLNPNAQGKLALHPSTRYDVAVGRSFRARSADGGGRAHIIAAVDNVLDTAVYDQCGLPQAGRTLRLQVVIR